MLINLSNHPSQHWSEVQLEESRKQFGGVMDMEFPDVDPQGDELYIYQLAEEYLKKILNIREKYPSLTVHLMGEFTFCFALVEKLKMNKVPCIASTTRRMVKMNNNTKITEFEFVRFRYY